MTSSLEQVFEFPLRHPLLIALRSPTSCEAFSEQQWRTVISVAYLTRMMANVADNCAKFELPPKVAKWLDGTKVLMHPHRKHFLLDLDDLTALFADANMPVMALKGGAYHALNLPFAASRISNDIDLMVRFDDLDKAESLLAEHGWTEQEENIPELHRQYYRQWLHELPPKENEAKGCVLDLHHRLLPRTDRVSFEPEAIWTAARRSAQGILVPDAPDLVLHSAVHLFRNGQFFHGIRDLYDLKNLFDFYGQDQGFWDALVERAETLGLARSLAYAQRYVGVLFGSKFPEEFVIRLERALPSYIGLFDRLVATAVLPKHVERFDFKREIAMWALSHQPLPRFAPVFTWLFWAKRFAKPPEPEGSQFSDIQNDQSILGPDIKR